MYSKKRIINKFNGLCEWVRDVRLNVAIERYCYGIKWKRVQDVWCQGRHYHAETLERGWWMHDDHDPHQPPSGWHPDLAIPGTPCPGRQPWRSGGALPCCWSPVAGRSVSTQGEPCWSPHQRNTLSVSPSAASRSGVRSSNRSRSRRTAAHC